MTGYLCFDQHLLRGLASDERLRGVSIANRSIDRDRTPPFATWRTLDHLIARRDRKNLVIKIGFFKLSHFAGSEYFAVHFGSELHRDLTFRDRRQQSKYLFDPSH